LALVIPYQGEHCLVQRLTYLECTYILNFRYKLKFSADKVDIMIVQAIGLLDDLDKEINIYAMRVREWYGT